MVGCLAQIGACHLQANDRLRVFALKARGRGVDEAWVHRSTT